MSRIVKRRAAVCSVPHECDTLLFAFRLFSFVITNASTQLRKYLAGSHVCVRQFGRIFLYNDCTFVYSPQRQFSTEFTTRGSGFHGFYLESRARRFRAESPSQIEPNSFFYHISNLSAQYRNDSYILV